MRLASARTWPEKPRNISVTTALVSLSVSEIGTAGAVPTALAPRFFDKYAQWRSPPGLNSRPEEYAVEVGPLARQAATRSAHCCSLVALLRPASLRTGDQGGWNGLGAAGTRRWGRGWGGRRDSILTRCRRDTKQSV